MNKKSYCCWWPIVLLIFFTSCQPTSSPYSTWHTYAGTPDAARYSALTQIDTTNVHLLQPAWQFSSGDKDTANRSQNQCNSLIIDGVLYGTSPRLKLFALNAATGAVQWIFDPAQYDTVTNADPYAYYKVSRGLASWAGRGKRTLYYSVGAFTWCINAATGLPDSGFGTNGRIHLLENLDRAGGAWDQFLVATTPGIVYKDLLIMGSRVNESNDAAPGHIRAYDVRTGALRWIFHTIPHPGEVGYDTWPDTAAYRWLGGANCWAGMSLDEQAGVVYVPTGSVSGDFYGGHRPGSNLFGNCLIALEAATGKYLWHYQMVHHDLWDRDLPANPNLLTLTVNGKQVKAVAQITKHGYLFVLDRTNGTPLFPVQEVPVPQLALPGEQPWPTQPIPSLPPPFARQYFDTGDILNLNAASHAYLLQQYNQVKHTQAFTPPSKEGSWIFPGFDGGGEWGGAAGDVQTGIMYVNSSELPWSLTMVDAQAKSETAAKQHPGKALYLQHCSSCHGNQLQGNGPSFPALINLQSRYMEMELESIIKNGRNMMPGFSNISPASRAAMVAYLLNKPYQPVANSEEGKEPEGTQSNLVAAAPYKMTGYHRFLDPQGYPGIKPPWGTLNAINLNTGQLLWKVPLGEYPELTAKGWPPTGTENYGGPVVTAGGLVFIAATRDSKIRAFHKNTGTLLWEYPLPVPGYATPSVYIVQGKQYLVIACGGGKIGSPSGDVYMAFALPDNAKENGK